MSASHTPSQAPELATTLADALQRARAARALYGDHPCSIAAFDDVASELLNASPRTSWIVGPSGLQDVDADDDDAAWSAESFGADLHLCGIVSITIDQRATREDLEALFEGLEASVRSGRHAAAWAAELGASTDGRIEFVVPCAEDVSIADGSRSNDAAAPKGRLARSLAPNARAADAATPEALARVIEREHASAGDSGVREVRERLRQSSGFHAAGSPPSLPTADVAHLQEVVEALSPKFRNALLQLPPNADENTQLGFAAVASLSPIADVLDALSSADHRSRLPSTAALMLFRRLSLIGRAEQTEREQLADALGVAHSLLDQAAAPGLDEIVGSDDATNDASDSYRADLQRMAKGEALITPDDRYVVPDGDFLSGSTHRARLSIELAQDQSIPDRLRARALHSLSSQCESLTRDNDFELLIEIMAIARASDRLDGPEGQAARALQQSLSGCGGSDGVLSWLANASDENGKAFETIMTIGPGPIMAAADRTEGREGAALAKLAVRALDALEDARLAELVPTLQPLGQTAASLWRDRLGKADHEMSARALAAMRESEDTDTAAIGFSWSFADSDGSDRERFFEKALQSSDATIRTLAIRTGLDDGDASLSDLVTRYAAGEMRSKASRDEILVICNAMASTRRPDDAPRLSEMFEAFQHDPIKRTDGTLSSIAEAMHRCAPSTRSMWLRIRWHLAPGLIRRIPGLGRENATRNTA